MKGVAVPYIIAIILGVIVLAVAVYLIYKVITGETLDCEECRAKFTGWCSTCYLANTGQTTWINEGSKLGDKLAKCLNGCNVWTGVNENQNCVGSQDACKLVGIPS